MNLENQKRAQKIITKNKREKKIMEIFLGEKGLKATWQEPFKKTIKCSRCGENCRIMFVAMENKEKEYICNLHENTGAKKNGKYWPHDAIACAVYLCEKCFEPNAEINQA